MSWLREKTVDSFLECLLNCSSTTRVAMCGGVFWCRRVTLSMMPMVGCYTCQYDMMGI